MVGAISSGNYLDAGVDKPVPLSAPKAAVKAAATGLPLDSLAPVILSQNPHMQFWNGSTWGYALLTITADSLVCDFRVASTIKQAGGTLQELASFQVPAGQAKLIPL
jgi:phosphodiesterase/alkaline phosphatase D-like protein